MTHSQNTIQHRFKSKKHKTLGTNPGILSINQHQFWHHILASWGILVLFLMLIFWSPPATDSKYTGGSFPVFHAASIHIYIWQEVLAMHFFFLPIFSQLVSVLAVCCRASNLKTAAFCS